MCYAYDWLLHDRVSRYVSHSSLPKFLIRVTGTQIRGRLEGLATQPRSQGPLSSSLEG